VVNYDLPWNPQRIEQRIGRCHRYGQKHDVVVVNFLNQKNEADLRVYQLLHEKFSLFTGVFGSSDEVLGTIESGVDFEMRIAAIYQNCRKPEQIKEAFDELQLELNFEINEAMRSTRQKLLENFDEEVQAKLKLRDEASRAFLSHFEKQLIALTRHELRDHATFHSDSSFSLHTTSFNGAPTGLYVLPRSTSTAHVYRLGHPLAEQLLTQAKERDLPPAELEFHYAEHGSKISILEPLRGQSGTLTVSLFTVESMDQAEDHLIYAACTDAGALLDQEQTRRLLSLPAVVKGPVLDLPAPEPLGQITAKRQTELQQIIAKRNGHYYEAEAEKLDGWADDLKVGLEREIKEMDRLIKEARRAAATALTLEDKLASQKQIKNVEAQRNEKRRSLFEAQDAIDQQREDLIGSIEGKLRQAAGTRLLFSIRWTLY
jgi:adenine-specific DNA-methyltransferase